MDQGRGEGSPLPSPGERREPRGTSGRVLWAPVLAGLAVGLVGRAVLLTVFPHNYSFDAFQRWAGRDHLLVQSWLPVTQAFIVANRWVGGSDWTSRVTLAGVALVAIVSGMVLAFRVAERRSAGLGVVAAWAMVLPASYGPFLVWSGALYQEGTFLAVLFTALALALGAPREQRLADLVIGGLALVRYEGWPCVAVYLLWRRDPRALVALWGPALWLVVKALHPAGFEASPIDFDDWNGIVERTTVASWSADALRLSQLAFGTGGLWLLAGAAWAGWSAFRARAASFASPILLLIVLLASQLVATGFWLAGLEMATQRMTVIPVMIAGVLAAVAVAQAWQVARLRPALVAGVVAFVAVGHGHAWVALGDEMEVSAPERALLADVPDACTLELTPRKRLGTRFRHDGCEIVQGVSERRHGDGLVCTTWGPVAGPPEGCVVRAHWKKGRYVVRE